MDILDQEASEDEGIRKNAKKDGRVWDRLPSYEANVSLTNKEKRYRQMLTHAADADETVRSKWEQWEEAITRLTWEDVCIILIVKDQIFQVNDYDCFRKNSRTGYPQLQPNPQSVRTLLRHKHRHTPEHYACISKHSTICVRSVHN